MTTTTFDALGYFEKLKAAGVPEEQAKVQAAAFREFTAIQDETARRELATKADILRLEAKIEETKRDLHIGLANAKSETLKWLMGLIVAQTALIVAVLTYVK